MVQVDGTASGKPREAHPRSCSKAPPNRWMASPDLYLHAPAHAAACPPRRNSMVAFSTQWVMVELTSPDQEGAGRAPRCVIELVGHERVGTAFGWAELDESTLGGLEIEGLTATLAGAGLKQVGAFLVDGVADRADHMERRAVRRPVIEHPDPNALVGLNLDRCVLVLVDVPVEHDRVVLLVEQLGEVGQVADISGVELGLPEHELMIDGGKTRRINDERAVHAAGDVEDHRWGSAVVHPDAGVVGDESIEM